MLLDDINGKKWKKLRGIKKEDLRDRSAPNFFIREHPLPQASIPMKNLLADINGKKWKKLRGIKKEDLRDRSAPNFFIREHPLPQASLAMKNLLADINGKKWKKLSAVPKDRYRDRSAPNLALWKIEKSAISPEYEKKYTTDKNAFQNDFYKPVPTTAEKAPVSNSTFVEQPAASHLHSDLNSAFPVSEFHQRNHNDNVGASWQGNTMGEKVKSLGKNFTGWVKEEILEVKDAVTHIGKKHHGNESHLTGGDSNTYPMNNAVQSDFVPPASSVQSGLKSEPVLDTRLGHANDQTIQSTSDKTIM